MSTTFEPKIAPIEKLMAEIDKVKYASQTCCYASCPNPPINSHTLSENSLYKINIDLKKVLVPESGLLRSYKYADLKSTRKIDKNEFSTFQGFCNEHDAYLFAQIDSFDGVMTAEKAALIHYRNICYGLHHLKKNRRVVDKVASKKYTKCPDDVGSEGDQVYQMSQGLANERIDMIIKEHEERKTLLEHMFGSKNFSEVDFIELKNGHNKLLFCGRSSVAIHPNHPIFDEPGYSSMPWISYITFPIERYSSTLIFCWLKQDIKYSEDLFTQMSGESFNNKILPLLAYVYSDSFAVDQEFYEKHQSAIDFMLKSRLL